MLRLEVAMQKVTLNKKILQGMLNISTFCQKKAFLGDMGHVP